MLLYLCVLDSPKVLVVQKSILLLGWILVLAGCSQVDSSDHDKSLTQKIFRPVIAQQCKSELKQSKLWKASSLFLAQNTQVQLQDEVCGCVSEHALDDVSTTRMLKATVSQSAKDELVRQAVLNSLSGCVKDALK